MLAMKRAGTWVELKLEKHKNDVYVIYVNNTMQIVF